MKRLAPLALSLLLALPMAARAEVIRPLPRPAAVTALADMAAAFASATELAPRQSYRPQRRVDEPAAPVALPAAPVAPPASATPQPLALGVLQGVPPALVALSMPRKTPVRTPVAMGPRPAVSISISTASAPVPVFVTAAAPQLRPRTRPETAAPAIAAPALEPGTALPRPLARPQALAATPVTVVAFASPRPRMKPGNLPARITPRAPPASQPEAQVVRAAAAPRIDPGRTLVVPQPSGKGGLCGDPRIKGSTLPPIGSKVNGCGIANPVRVTEVDGVRLSTAATLDCSAAVALRKWVTTGLKPAVGKAGVSEIRIAAHYACRPRNNVKGARISEHGRGRAIDIAGIVTANGKLLTVLGDYRSSAMLKQIRQAACGIFGTTLGPGSDRYHSDHFHFDTASHRNGPYCR